MLSALVFSLATAAAAPCDVNVQGDQLVLPEPLAFEPRTADLTAASAAGIQALQCTMLVDPTRTVQVEVHTDAQGSDVYNLRITQERADTIRAALLALGIEAERVTAVGYGERLPIADNATADGRASNRRVELYLSPPAERPPRPEVEPPPAPVAPAPVTPTPRPDPCVALRAGQVQGAGLPSPLRCEATAVSQSCWYAEGPETLGPRIQACLDFSADGTALYGDLPSGSLSLTPDREGSGGSILRFDPR